MLREPAELVIDDNGMLTLPIGLLAEAGLPPGSRVVAFSDGDGRIVLRREDDAVRHLLASGRLG